MKVETHDSFAYPKEEHQAIKMLVNIINKTSSKIETGDKVNPSDLNNINKLIEWIDKCHHAKEEEVIIPKLQSKTKNLDESIKTLLNDHKLGRNLVHNIRNDSENWMGEHKPNESLARNLRAYAAFLSEHIEKEDQVFDAKETKLFTDKDHEEAITQFDEIEKRIGLCTSKKMRVAVFDLHKKLG